ncbi:hypothetical protein QP948_03570 [Corynebacterium bovis]|uniref:hypothetical protein n=1 Tax=Corynebacterium bovis TaxID=36808 RepID=UPI00254AB2D3|nr:hypothetical protein [Corynebacterium bovis]MDK8510491.1 hypothetical protein [Corynebacterium bovis]
MFHALALAFLDSVNILLIGVIAALGVGLPRGARYGRVVGLLVAGDWLGVLLLALVCLLIFDGLGDVMTAFVTSPAFGVVLVATAVLVAVLTWRGGDGGGSGAVLGRVGGALRSPSVATLLTGSVLGVVQSATSVPFYTGLIVMSAGGFSPVVRGLGLLGYATVALSLPFLSAVVMGVVRAYPDSWCGRVVDALRRRPVAAAKTCGYVVAVLLLALGVTHLV